jgi:hypothetical protein
MRSYLRLATQDAVNRGVHSDPLTHLLRVYVAGILYIVNLTDVFDFFAA